MSFPKFSLLSGWIRWSGIEHCGAVLCSVSGSQAYWLSKWKNPFSNRVVCEDNRNANIHLTLANHRSQDYSHGTRSSYFHIFSSLYHPFPRSWAKHLTDPCVWIMHACQCPHSPLLRMEVWALRLTHGSDKIELGNCRERSCLTWYNQL